MVQLERYDDSLNPLIIPDDGITTFHNRHCDAKLRMLFGNHVWKDRESGEVVKVECHWTLSCDCESYEREH